MIFAICGLTVVGTGTECAGTSSIGEFAVWACATAKPAIPIAAHKSALAVKCHLTALRIPLARRLIAFSLFGFDVSEWSAMASAVGAFPATPGIG
jgi:hypothetical protein